MKLEERAALVKEWVGEAATFIRQQFETEIQVQTKSHRTDLVTNVDQAVEVFFRKKIEAHFPQDQYFGEEKMGDNPTSLNGPVWIVDPIDGTANFVLQQNHFAIMLGYYEDGEGLLGVIYDVMHDDYFEAIKGKGIRRNGEAFIPRYTDKQLDQSLIAINGGMVMRNVYDVQDLIVASMGLRIYGSAGIEIVGLMKGEIAAYISPRLQPWDIAAGMVFAEEMGLKVSQLSQEPVDLLQANAVIIAYPSTYDAMIGNFKNQ
ncbi:inositol monophosphatase family protein [Aerococcus agrisoli]|uniref:Inositol monophosphatase family protein n=1 Tax=Aerococcus agrisoli TaxID=2487350 RepID=A0A3N4G2U3_9LACT|nr:inositol monophosphatase family protein [Aerococcus agrisoli]RPA57279.1 inositol monophosphatase family protein [Aerococcus agrisoli]